MAENEPAPKPSPSLADIADAAARELAKPAPPPAAKPPAAERKRRPTGNRARTLALTSGVVCLSVAVVFALMQMSSGGESSPEALLARAQRQVTLGHWEQARDTLAAANGQRTDAAPQKRFDELSTKVDAVLVRQADRVTLDNAESALRTLRSFERIYLPPDESPRRSAARELIRNTDRWLERFRETCERHEDHRADVAEVIAMRERYAPAADLDQPDNADDVLFRADYLVHLKRRRYREAVGTLTAWLDRSPGDPRAAEVRAREQELRDRGRAWASTRLRRVDQMLERSMWDDARAEIEFLSEHGLPEWEPLLARARNRLRDRQ